MKRWILLLFVCLGVFVWAPTSSAHALDDAKLRLEEVEANTFVLDFEAGSPSLHRELETPVVLPPGCKMDGAFVRCGALGLAGTLRFPWLRGTTTRLFVELSYLDGSRELALSTSSHPELTVYPERGAGLFGQLKVATDYLVLGVEHILGGIDHLFFVIALSILVQRRKTLLVAVTAFTVAHSLTLALTALGWARVPTASVEALIALSVVLMCAEGLKRHQSSSWLKRLPWLSALLFGLLHGLGFASALLEIGLPKNYVPISLLSFNLGVEAGQLGVIALFELARTLNRRWPIAPRWVSGLTLYLMGSWAAFWTIERVLSVVL